MRFSSKTAIHAALAAAFTFGAAASGHAQASPVAAGGGEFLAQNGEDHLFAFHVVELPDGKVTGRAGVYEPVTQGFVHMEISSYMYIGDWVGVAGPITMAVNAPPQFAVGATAFFVVSDNGAGLSAPDAFAGLGAVPPMFGNLTIQQIVGLIGPPPPAAFSPLLAGDIKIL